MYALRTIVRDLIIIASLACFEEVLVHLSTNIKVDSRDSVLGLFSSRREQQISTNVQFLSNDFDSTVVDPTVTEEKRFFKN